MITPMSFKVLEWLGGDTGAFHSTDTRAESDKPLVAELRSVGSTLPSNKFVDGLGATMSMNGVSSKSRDSAKGNSRRCLYAPLLCVY